MMPRSPLSNFGWVRFPPPLVVLRVRFLFSPAYSSLSQEISFLYFVQRFFVPRAFGSRRPSSKFPCFCLFGAFFRILFGFFGTGRGALPSLEEVRGGGWSGRPPSSPDTVPSPTCMRPLVLCGSLFFFYWSTSVYVRVRVLPLCSQSPHPIIRPNPCTPKVWRLRLHLFPALCQSPPNIFSTQQTFFR